MTGAGDLSDSGVDNNTESVLPAKERKAFISRGIASWPQMWAGGGGLRVPDVAVLYILY